MEETRDQKTQATGFASKEEAGAWEKPHGNPFEASAGLGWADVPVGFYLLGAGTAGLFLASVLVPLDRLLMNEPQYTLLYLNVWRVVAPFLVTPDVFSFAFSLLALYMMSVTEERFAGSARYLLEVLYRSVAIQLVYTAVGFGFWLFLGVDTRSFGVWPVYMVIITLRCLEFPEKETYLCWLYFPVKNKRYPLLLLLLFLPWGFIYGLTLDIWVAFCLAHLMNQSPAVEKAVDPSPAAIQALEKWLLSFSFSYGAVVTEAAAAAGDNNRRAAAGVQQGEYFAPQEGPLYASAPAHPYPQLQTGPPQQPPHLHSAFRGAGLVVGGTAPFASNCNYPSPQPDPQASSSHYPLPASAQLQPADRQQ